MTKVITTNKGIEILVDDDDYDKLSKYSWSINNGYAISTDRTSGKQKTLRMHRLVLDVQDGEFVDHINGNRIDNRKSNLRKCDAKGNAKNAGKRKGALSKFKGVYPRNGKWVACIQNDRKRVNLGKYKHELDAAYYYNEQANLLHGEFARLNILPEGYVPVEDFQPYSTIRFYSQYRGVTYCKKDKRWRAQIQHKSKHIYIGNFWTERIAAEMYNVFAIELHKEKAVLNEF
ncbi:hypothetical protein ACIQXW_23670 [Lysinibacillus sp. NPDC097162]|uniref:hypothetical protein n=1 Tax=Lysinibacillus sp. NPDC097162 TaxID=3364140 RepID=UPI0037F4E872